MIRHRSSSAELPLLVIILFKTPFSTSFSHFPTFSQLPKKQKNQSFSNQTLDREGEIERKREVEAADLVTVVVVSGWVVTVVRSIRGWVAAAGS